MSRRSRRERRRAKREKKLRKLRKKSLTELLCDVANKMARELGASGHFVPREGEKP